MNISEIIADFRQRIAHSSISQCNVIENAKLAALCDERDALCATLERKTGDCDAWNRLAAERLCQINERNVSLRELVAERDALRETLAMADERHRLELAQLRAGHISEHSALVDERDALRVNLAVADNISGSFFGALRPILTEVNVQNPGQHITKLIAERDALHALAERAYPGLRASGGCSRHREPDGHFECLQCYPDLPALILAHVEAHQETINERDALRAASADLCAACDALITERDGLRQRLEKEEGAHAATANELWDAIKERDEFVERTDALRAEVARLNESIGERGDERAGLLAERDALRAELAKLQDRHRKYIDQTIKDNSERQGGVPSMPVTTARE